MDASGRVTIADVVKRLAVSAVTARGDLDALSDTGAIVRSHGGAVRRLEATRDFPVDFKATLHRAEKQRIGETAARLVKPNETIILDSGTTTAEVARAVEAVAARAPHRDYKRAEHRYRALGFSGNFAHHDRRNSAADFALLRGTAGGKDAP